MICEKGCRLYLGCSYHNLLGAFNVDNIFIVHVKKPVNHFFIKGQGYPINKELLEYLQERNVERLLIPERTKKYGFRVFESSVSDYLNGVEISEGGFEPQMVIPICYLIERPLFKKYEKNMMRLLYTR